MKTPRIDEFDPTAAAALKSPMDDLPAIQPPRQPARPVVPVAPASPAENDSPSSQPPREGAEGAYGTPPVRAYARSGRVRTITRYAFEFYQDQIEALRHLALLEKAAGRKGSMSEMVREALDAYLTGRGGEEH